MLVREIESGPMRLSVVAGWPLIVDTSIHEHKVILELYIVIL